jgi:glutaredoxin
MKFYLYGRTNPPCPFCKNAKQLLDSKGSDYVYIDIGKDIQLSEFSEMFPDQRTVPLIIVEKDGEREKVGGFTELDQYFKNQVLEGLSL